MLMFVLVRSAVLPSNVSHCLHVCMVLWRLTAPVRMCLIAATITTTITITARCCAHNDAFPLSAMRFVQHTATQTPQ